MAINEKPFLIQINSIDDFAKFLRVIRNEETEAKELQLNINRLKDSQVALDKAVESSKKGE